MNRLLILLFILLYNTYNSQTYEFDYHVVVSYSSNNYIAKHTLYYNFQNNNSLYEFQDGNMKLFDSENQIMYDLKRNSKGKIIRFKKVKLNKFPDEFSVDHIIIDKLKENQYQIKTFDKKDKTKAAITLIVEVEKNNLTNSKLYFMDYSQNIQQKILKKLEEYMRSKNFLIKKIEMTTSKDYHSIQQVENLNFEKFIINL